MGLHSLNDRQFGSLLNMGSTTRIDELIAILFKKTVVLPELTQDCGGAYAEYGFVRPHIFLFVSRYAQF